MVRTSITRTQIITKKQEVQVSSSLSAKDLVKSYNGRKVVDGVSFNIKPGEAVALLGPNGAGKTTCFDMVVGLVKPDQGNVELDDKDITKLKIHERASLGIGYLTQEPSAFRQLTVRDNLYLILDELGIPAEERKEKTRVLLEEFGIFHLKDTYAVSLSGGERRRLEITRVLTTDPKFILLDEPFTGVDPLAIQDIQEILKNLCQKKNIGILITDHNPRATLSIVDRAYIIQDGRIIMHGNSNDIANDERVKKYYLGSDFKL